MSTSPDTSKRYKALRGHVICHQQQDGAEVHSIPRQQSKLAEVYKIVFCGPTTRFKAMVKSLRFKRDVYRHGTPRLVPLLNLPSNLPPLILFKPHDSRAHRAAGRAC